MNKIMELADTYAYATINVHDPETRRGRAREDLEREVAHADRVTDCLRGQLQEAAAEVEQLQRERQAFKDAAEYAVKERDALRVEVERLRLKSEPVSLLWQVRNALARASAICDAIPNREPGHLGVLVNAQSDGAHGYHEINDALAALDAHLTTPETDTATERETLRTQLAAAQADAVRLDWMERKLFVRTWNGVIDSGSNTRWRVADGDYRRMAATMNGDTFREAIDAAMKGQQ